MLRLASRLALAGHAALFVCLVTGCTDTRGEPDAGMTVTRDSGTSHTQCTYDFECKNGACECIRGGESCCHPDECGESAPSSCQVVCEECTGDPNPDPGTPTDGGAGEPDEGDPEPVVCGGASSCWLDCIAERRSTYSCERACEVATPADEVGCGRACIENGDSTYSCQGYCNFGTACGQAACADVCIANGDSTYSCTGYCDFDTGAGQAACADVCIANGDSTYSCTGYCNFDTGAGEAACADVCIANGDSTYSCTGYCNFDTAEGSAACRRVCAANGDSASSCDGYCG